MRALPDGTLIMMPMTSLRGKILSLLAGTVFVIALFVAILSQRDITQTISERESRAIDNTVDLISLNIATRWSALLDSKIHMVRSERAQLMEIGTLLLSSLEGYAQEAEEGILTREQAQAAVQAWINRLLPEKSQRRIFIYDRNDRIVVSTDPAWIGRDMSGVRDFKGRPLAEAMREESRMLDNGFTIYEIETLQGKENQFVHFRYFQPWDWVVSVSDSSEAIAAQVEFRKNALEAEVHQTLSSLVLAQSGFVFILADDGRFIVPPPQAYAKLLESSGGGPNFLSALSLEKNATGNIAASGAFRFHDGRRAWWQVKYAHFRPLAWTLVALVPEMDLILPAQQLVNRQFAIFAVVLGLSLLCAFFFTTRIVRPLTQLTRFAQALPEQDFLSDDSGVPGHIAALPTKSRDEIGHLAAAFLFMDQRLRENVLRLVRETTKRERIESELDIARSIQLGLLPLPLETSLSATLNLEARMLPAKEVGGDLYDYFMISGNQLCFVIGDVSGKGVPAALFMAITRTLVRSAAKDEDDPGRMMEAINDRLSETNPNLMFVTLFLGLLNLESNELRYVNAGHPPSILITRDGRARRLEGRSGPACGVQEGISYRTFSIRLDSGDTLLGYTDGITEAIDEEGTQYGEARLLEILGHPTKNAEETVAGLLADVEAFTAGTEPFDDITLIAAQLS
ncbi:MAG: SpoIIE family protein phosphatase [Candidatus Accumulibacter sp.]|jgi:sigma-B regulation protein RsbU (phosphoserine phosphatase)|nr:SpoIIE family protein phosphatase [Accumulibacter sp.]